jgi:hypothetical protein
MNALIFRITRYIMNKNITEINLEKILYDNSVFINEYRYLMANVDVESFQFKIHVFKKLVLYDYCFNYKIDNFSDDPIELKKELKLINDYILHNHKKILHVHVLDDKFREFLDWCRKYNSVNKKKIYFVDSGNKIIFK